VSVLGFASGPSPFGGAVGLAQFGFEVPPGDPGEVEQAARGARELGQSFSDHAAAVRAASQVALGGGGGWQGPASASFAEYAGSLASVCSANAGACDTAAGALTTFAAELAAAQLAARQALSECERCQQELATQQRLAQDAQAEADAAARGAAGALHPAVRASFEHQLAQASSRAGAAHAAAGSALDALDLAERQGQAAAARYREALQVLQGRLAAAAGEFRSAPLPAGGVPVPLTVTASDARLASALVASAGGLPGLLRVLNDPGALARLDGGELTPGAALAFVMDAQAELAAAAAQRPKPRSEGVFGWLEHQAVGFADGAWSATKGTVEMVIHPSRLVQAGETLMATSPLYQMFVLGRSPSAAVADAAQTSEAVVKGLVDWKDWRSGNYGRALGTIVVALAGTKGAGEVASGVRSLVSDSATITREGVDAAAAARPAIGGAGPVIQGQAGVERTVRDLEAAGGSIVGREITAEAAGVRVRVDLYAQLPHGQMAFIEVKTGEKAALSARQVIAYPAIIKDGGVAFGQRAVEAGLAAGRPFPPTQVWVVHQPWPLP
jgi:hypothetical protein